VHAERPADRAFSAFPSKGKVFSLRTFCGGSGEGDDGLAVSAGYSAGDAWKVGLVLGYRYLGRFEWNVGEEAAWMPEGSSAGHEGSAALAAECRSGILAVGWGGELLFRNFTRLHSLSFFPAVYVRFSPSDWEFTAEASAGEDGPCVSCTAEWDFAPGGLRLKPLFGTEWDRFYSILFGCKIASFSEDLVLSAEWEQGIGGNRAYPATLCVLKHWGSFGMSFAFRPAWDIAGKWEASVFWEW